MTVPERSAVAPAGGKSVLLIDDDEFIRRVVSLQLRELGSAVTTANDGHVARRLLRENGPFDLVVCDLKMPQVDGIELLRDFALLRPSPAIVLMSSVDAKTLETAEQLARSHGLRFLGRLTKPVAVDAFLELFKRLDAAPAPKPPAPRAPAVTVNVDELRAAIVGQEIDVYVQPKVDLRTGGLAGVEALARWIRPDGKVVPPISFIELAERAGLMSDLTDLVVRQALSACGLWQREALHTSIAVNIPASSLARLELPDRIAAEAARHGVNHDDIIIEITETGTLTDLTRLLDVVTRLRLRGFRLAVDDFGIGYSSLERLRMLPFTELKLDREFVDGASGNPEQRSIVESTIHMAHELQLKTCAEGVETAADLEMLKTLECDLAQGYVIARPMPKLDLPAWVAKYTPSTGRAGSDPGGDFSKRR